MKLARLSFTNALFQLLLAAALLSLAACAGTMGSTGGGGGTLPAAPTGVAATAGNAQVALTWSTDATANGYAVKRATTSGGPYTTIATPSAPTYTDAGVTNGTKYFYVVSASNTAGSSANSAEVSATPTAPQQAPPAPANLAATGGNAQVMLSWSASSGATSYTVKRSTTSGAETQLAGGVSATTYTDATAKNGTKYFYEVSASNASGESANSSEASATPTAPQQAPPAPTNLAAVSGNAQVALTWTASTGATSYTVKRSTTSGAEMMLASATTTAYTDTTAKNGTKYFYVVSASNSTGESANSNEASATPTAPQQAPPAPTSLAAAAGNAQVALTWAASTGATGYNIKRGTSSGTETQLATSTSAAYTDSTAKNGTKYFYVVSATNSTGQSANSNEVSATPTAPAQAPATPANLAATASKAQVALTWSASGGATSYHVKRSTTSGAETQISAPTATNYTDTSLTNGTKYFYVVSAVNATGESANSTEVNATPSAPTQADVTITVDPTKTHAISPYIYGINFYDSSDGVGITFDRDGGDRWTAYNWETNASNAGSDYLYENDDYLSSSTVPAEAVRSFIAGDQSNDQASLVTVQMQGLVAADESGPVSVTNPPDLSRFKTVVDAKSSVTATPFTITPPSTDANVYMDEFVWALDQKFSGMGIFGAGATHPTFINLDNEPELWNTTHLEVQGSTPISSDAYITKTIALTTALKNQFPEMLIFGPVHYGFEGIYSWQGELNATPNGTNWFPDKYLPAIKAASTTFGKPLVDVYDFHWYVEEYDSSGTRAIDMNGATLTAAQVQLIVQSPRALWDPTFTDSGNSNPWIYETLGNTPINILGRLQTKINAENPGMRVAITEYENGGGGHIAGTIAQADDLGIFANENLFAASFWPPYGTYTYTLGGFRAFRDFDGSGANFGDTSLSAASSNVASVLVYASTDSATPGRTVFVAINKATSAQVVAINGATLSGTAHLYQMTATSTAGQTPVAPVSAGTQTASGTSLTVTLPALSVTTIDVH